MLPLRLEPADHAVDHADYVRHARGIGVEDEREEEIPGDGARGWRRVSRRRAGGGGEAFGGCEFTI